MQINSVSSGNTNRQRFGMSLTKRLAREGMFQIPFIASSGQHGNELMQTLENAAKNAAGLQTVIDYNLDSKLITLDGLAAKANNYKGLNLIGKINKAVEEAKAEENPTTKERILNYSNTRWN